MAEIGEKRADRSLTVTANYWSHASGNRSLHGATLCCFSPRLAFSTTSASCIHQVAESLVKTCLSRTLWKITEHSHNQSWAHGWTASYDKVPSIQSLLKWRRTVLGMEKPQHLLLYKTEVPKQELTAGGGRKKSRDLHFPHLSIKSYHSPTFHNHCVTTKMEGEKKSLHLIKGSKWHREGKHGSLKRWKRKF